MRLGFLGVPFTPILTRYLEDFGCGTLMVIGGLDWCFGIIGTPK